MTRTRLASLPLIVFAVFAGVGTAATSAHDEDGSGHVTPVTGRFIEWVELDAGAQETEAGLVADRGVISEGTIEWSDPRLPAAFTLVNNYDQYVTSDDEPELGIGALSMRLDGLAGDWTGGALGFERADGVGSELTILQGDGAYEGLTLIYTCGFSDEEESVTCDGAIIEGELPPTPDQP